MLKHPITSIVAGIIVADIIVGSCMIASDEKILPEGVKFGFYKTDSKER